MRGRAAALLTWLLLLAPSALAQAPGPLLWYEPLEPGPDPRRFVDHGGARNTGDLLGFEGPGDGVLNQTPGDVARLRFDGPRDVLLASALQVAPSVVSVSFWLNTTQPGGGIAAFRSSDNATYDLQAYMSDDGRVHFGIASRVLATVASSNVSVADGRWHHVVGIANATDKGLVELYVDGRLADRSGGAPLAPFRGRWGFGDGAFDATWPAAPASPAYRGDLGPMRVYARALDAGDVASLHKQGPTRVPADAFTATLAPSRVPLGTTSTVTATVRALGGAPLAGMAVRLCGGSLGGDGACTAPVATDAAGKASLSVFPTSTGDLTLLVNGEARGTVTAYAGLVVTLTPPDPRAGEVVAGTVASVGATLGEPGASVHVARDGAALPGLSRTTGPNGHFELGGLEEGAYVVTASKAGFDDATANLVVRPAPPPPPAASFTLARLVAPATAPPGEPFSVRADVRNVGAAEGVAEVLFLVDGLVRDARAVAVAPGDARTVEFAFRPPRTADHQVAVKLAGGATLAGTVRVEVPAVRLDVDGAPDGDRALLHVRATDGPPGSEAYVVDERGRRAPLGPTPLDVAWPGPPGSGRYRIEVWGPGDDGQTSLLAHETVLVRVPLAQPWQRAAALLVAVGLVAVARIPRLKGLDLWTFLRDRLLDYAAARWQEKTQRLLAWSLRLWAAALVAALLMGSLAALAEPGPFVEALKVVGAATVVLMAATIAADIAMGNAARATPGYHVWTVGTLTLLLTTLLVRIPFGYTGYYKAEQEPTPSAQGRAALAGLGVMAALAAAFLLAAHAWSFAMWEAGIPLALGALAAAAFPFHGTPGRAVWTWSKPVGAVAIPLALAAFFLFEGDAASDAALWALGGLGALTFVACLLVEVVVAKPEEDAEGGSAGA
ncbi:MAG TPA: LamG-like jellyroll fold domain-containing protein [Candidatus Thermoplasmatota archaeon]|nr:LamG-like jellyroll fold domain-containing protein [Candidatus Thermoplasmatota archaeon]